MKKIIKIKQIWLTLLLYVECSNVIVKNDQEGYHVEDYCPKIGICEEGTHFICNYYNQNHEKSIYCLDIKNVSMNAEFAKLILNSVNGIRSRLARGMLMGIKLFPRAYGMRRLEWDMELASLAQMWVEQCILSEDTCRATKKFPDPAQIRATTHFNLSWIPLTGVHVNLKPGFSMDKVKFGVKAVLAYWYSRRHFLKELEAVVNGDLWDEDIKESPFLSLIQGSATHIGCGVAAFAVIDSAYKTFEYVNAVRLVCNLSKRLREGDKVYDIYPRNNLDHTKKCGCPLGYDEDPHCMCYQSGRKQAYKCEYGDCVPKVVILPIFTLENKPAPTRKPSNITSEKPKNHRKYQRNMNSSDWIQSKGSPIFEYPEERIRYQSEKLDNLQSFNEKDVISIENFTDMENVISSYMGNRKYMLYDETYTGDYP